MVTTPALVGSQTMSCMADRAHAPARKLFSAVSPFDLSQTAVFQPVMAKRTPAGLPQSFGEPAPRLIFFYQIVVQTCVEYLALGT